VSGTGKANVGPVRELVPRERVEELMDAHHDEDPDIRVG
jgi:hypothetical protein